MQDNKHALDNESVQVGQLLNGRLGGCRQMLLLVLAGDGVLVTEDKVDLHTRTVTEYCDNYYRGSRHTFVPGHVKSGPNMIVHGVLSENSLPSVWKPSSSNLM